MSNLKILTTFSLFILFLPVKTNGQEINRDELRQLTKSFVEQNITIPDQGKIEVTPAEIDPRITLQPCQSSLVFNIPEKRHSRNVNVKISCEDSTPWQMFLPVKVKSTVPVVIASRTIEKGSVIDSSNVRVEYRDHTRLRGETLQTVEHIIGAKSRRTIRKGKVFTKSNFCIVCKGENISIVAQSASFAIKTDGIALSDGNLGDQIRVKNTRSGRTITGTVVSINNVAIN